MPHGTTQTVGSQTGCYTLLQKRKEKRKRKKCKRSASDIIGCPLFFHLPNDMPVLPFAQHSVLINKFQFHLSVDADMENITCIKII